MRNSTMSLLEKRYLHHCSFRLRRTSEPETNLSLSWRKFVASSVLLHTHKYGETRIRTKFRFVSRTEIQSRLRKRANQDSPWKTKRANSRWSQNRDPEARTSSRVWWKKCPGINWNYWFSAKGNWSYYCKWWTTPTRSTTTSRTTRRTKSGSSWNSYQKSSWDGRIEESSRITNRWIFEKKIDRKSGHFLMNSRPEFRNYRMKSIVWMTREILTVPSQYAVDHPTDTHVLTSTGDPLHLVNVKFQTQSWIRDFRRDRQPEIHSTPRREDSQIIMGQTNKDCRSRIFILANSLLQQHSLVVR